MDHLLELMTSDIRIAALLLCIPVSIAGLFYVVWVMMIAERPYARLRDLLDRAIYEERLKRGPVTTCPDYDAMRGMPAAPPTEAPQQPEGEVASEQQAPA